MKKVIKVAVLLIVVMFCAQTAFAYLTGKYGGPCVGYVKNQKPGGYNWNILYSVKDQYGHTIPRLMESWVLAKDIWTRLVTHSRGSKPMVNSVMVLDQYPNNSAGHVAIVTGVQPSYNSAKQITGYVIQVKHSGLEVANMEAFGWFKCNLSGSSVIYSPDGKTWGTTSYQLLGFIYVP